MRPHIGRIGPVTWTEVSPNLQSETNEDGMIIYYLLVRIVAVTRIKLFFNRSDLQHISNKLYKTCIFYTWCAQYDAINKKVK